MSADGFIKLHRKIQDCALWGEERKFSKAEAWIDILLEVRWKEEPIEAITGIFTGRGQSIKSLTTWAKRWGWNGKHDVSRFFQKLKNMGMITTEKFGKVQRLTVTNYAHYQGFSGNDCNDDATNMQRTCNEHATMMQPEEERRKKKARTEESFEPKGSCPESEKSAPNRKQKKPKITFNFESKKFEGIEESDIEFWKDSFPAVEIIPELKKIAAWLVSNPTKKKANYPRFITNWFSKTQDKGGNVGGYATAKTAKKNTRPMMTEKEQNSCPHFFEFLQKKITLAEVTRRTGKFFPDDQYLRCDGKPYSEEPDGEVIEIEPEEEEKTESIFSKGFGVLDLNGKMPF